MQPGTGETFYVDGGYHVIGQASVGARRSRY
jgi:hypothetical protein